MKLKKLVILKTLNQTLSENSIYNYEYKNGKHSITEDKVPNPGWKEAIQDLRVEFKQEIQELRNEFKQDMQELRNEFNQDMQELRNEFKQDMQELRNEFKQDINELKQIILDGFAQVNKRLDKVEERLDRVEQDIKDIKECPTIKRELKLIKKAK